MDIDPFTLVYSTLWDLIENNDEITDLVHVGNRVKFDDARAPKESIVDADTPELQLRPESFITSIKATSSTTDIVKDYTLFISTGNWDLEEHFNRMSWELIRACISWDTILTAIKWNDKAFVFRFELLDAQEGTSELDLERGLDGWAALWRIQVYMQFLTSDIRISEV